MSQLVFDYFCERTPRSYVESRETSLVWNYKYAGKDLAQLLLGCKNNLQEEGQVSVNWESEIQNQWPLPLSQSLQFLSWTALVMYILVKLHLVRSDGFLMLVTNEYFAECTDSWDKYHRCGIWEGASSGYATASMDRAHLKCSCGCCARQQVSGGPSCWCFKGNPLFKYIHLKEQCRMWGMEITENMIDGHSDLLVALANLTRS
jgi:hypothetical protein